MPGSFSQVQSLSGAEALHVLRDPAVYQRLAQEVLQASNSFQVWRSLSSAASPAFAAVQEQCRRAAGQPARP